MSEAFLTLYWLISRACNIHSLVRTFVEGLHTNTDKNQTLMSWNTQDDIFIVRSRHPKREPATIDQRESSKFKKVIQHGFEAVGFLWRDIFVLSANVSGRNDVEGLLVQM